MTKGLKVKNVLDDADIEITKIVTGAIEDYKPVNNCKD